MQEYRLKVSHIYKSFPGVQALKDINFAVRKGTVHVLCGENGAGKSTLMKIINGIYKADIGGIEIDGKPVQIKNPIQAKKLGISRIELCSRDDSRRKFIFRRLAFNFNRNY